VAILFTQTATVIRYICLAHFAVDSPRRRLDFLTKRAQIGPMSASHKDTIATLRIEIKYIEPLIWRRVAVRPSMNLTWRF
jgi:hypothetical protein